LGGAERSGAERSGAERSGAERGQGVAEYDEAEAERGTVLIAASCRLILIN